MHSAFILQNIGRHISLNKEEEAHFMAQLQEKLVPKKTFLQREGNLCRNIYYVNSGTLRAFFTDKTGRESTIMFAIAGWWITDMFCFINRQPAMLQLEALEDSQVYQLSRDDWESLLNDLPVFEKYFRILMQNAYTREQLRIIQNLSIPAEERYHNFLNKYPLVAKQVTQKQIASYLGITPEFLSALRSKKNRKTIS